MKPNPKTEIGRAIHDAGRVPGWNFRPAAIRRFQVGHCEVIVVPVRIFADRRARRPAMVTRRKQGMPQGGAA
ncbi:MAG TPA: hypothetical protein VFY97_05800 [Rhodanobacteraceae bacterium]|nr:hypothetical protein [Rhodanobacteraceae bacterium]